MPKHSSSAAETEAVPSLEGGSSNAERSTAKTRLNLELPSVVADQLSTVAKLTSRSKTDFLRLAIGTYAVLVDEARRGHRIVIEAPDGAPVKEVIIPL